MLAEGSEHAYTGSVRRLCLCATAPEDDLTTLGGDRARWLRYRTMVRHRLSRTIRHAFPRVLAAVGEERFALLEARFFAEGALSSPFIRFVPGEFSSWLEAHAGAGVVLLPPAVLELGRLEWTELAVSYEEDDPAHVEDALSMERGVLLTRAHRMLAFEHAVHTYDAADPKPIERAATWLCVYRERETHEVRVLSTTRVAHALLVALGRGGSSLFACIQTAAADSGSVVDRAFSEGLAELLADLSERGVVLGGRAD